MVCTHAAKVGGGPLTRWELLLWREALKVPPLGMLPCLRGPLLAWLGMLVPSLPAADPSTRSHCQQQQQLCGAGGLVTQWGAG